MDEEATAEWTVIEDSCGYVEGFGSPYARGLFGASLNGKIQGALPIEVTTADGLTTVDLPDYLTQISKNTIAAAIPEGAVTSITVTDALLIDEYQTGDLFSVVDPDTGKFVKLSVTANTTAGSFTISATGTATDEIPVGGILIPIFIVRSAGGGSGTVTSIGYTAPAAGLSITGTNPVTTTGTWTFALTNDLLGLEGLSGTGIAVRTDVDTWALRSITNGTGISITNGDGVAGNIQITNSLPDQTVVLTPGAGIGVSGTYPNFTISNTFTNNQSFLDDGVPVTGRSKVNFLDNTDISFTLNDDSVNGETEITALVVANAITNAKFRQSVGLSVVGRSASTTGNVADITAANDFEVLRRSGTSLGFGQVATGGVADDAITYAKIQNITAASRLLGRGSAAGAGNVEEITLGAGLAMTGTVLSSTATGNVDHNGTGVANQVAYFIDADTIGSDACLTLDATNNRVTVSGTVASTTAGQAFLNVRGGSITGSVNAIHADANISATWGAVIENVRNLAGAAAMIEVKVGGTSAADPFVLFTVPSGTSTVLGVDNSDGDKFKITPGGTAPGSTANKGLTLTTDAATLAGINRDAPLYHMDVNGRVRATTGFIGDGVTWNSGLIAFGTGAGTGGSLLVNSITGCDNWMYLSFTTGNAPTANGTIFTATYPNAWPGAWAASFVTWSPFNANAATDIAKFRGGNRTNTNFTLVANGTLTANTNYQFCFQIGSMD